MHQNNSSKLENFIEEKKAATSLINSVGNLSYNKGIELVLFRRHLIDKNVSDILRLHQYATDFVNKPINIFDSTEIANILTQMDLSPAKIDVGKLTYEYIKNKANAADGVEYTVSTDSSNKTSPKEKVRLICSLPSAARRRSEGALYQIPIH